jgi:hypothetical protein
MEPPPVEMTGKKWSVVSCQLQIPFGNDNEKSRAKCPTQAKKSELKWTTSRRDKNPKTRNTAFFAHVTSACGGRTMGHPEWFQGRVKSIRSDPRIEKSKYREPSSPRLRLRGVQDDGDGGVDGAGHAE